MADLKFDCFRVHKPADYFVIPLKAGGREQLAMYFDNYFDEKGDGSEQYDYEDCGDAIMNRKDARTILIPYCSVLHRLFNERLNEVKIKRDPNYPDQSDSLWMVLEGQCSETLRKYGGEETVGSLFYGKGSGRTTSALMFGKDLKGRKRVDLEDVIEGILDTKLKELDEHVFALPMKFDKSSLKYAK